MYVAGYIGETKTAAATISLQQSGAVSGRILFRDVPFSGRSFHSPIYYGYRAGFYFTTHFGLDAEFIHLKIYADPERTVDIGGTINGAELRERAPMRKYVQQFEVSHGLNMVLINGVARRTLLGNRDPALALLALVTRAGIGPTIPRPEVIVLGAGGGSYQRGPVGLQGAAGVEGRLWRAVRILVEYKYTFTPTSFDVPNGSASLHVHSQHLVAGFAVHF